MISTLLEMDNVLKKLFSWSISLLKLNFKLRKYIGSGDTPLHLILGKVLKWKGIKQKVKKDNNTITNKYFPNIGQSTFSNPSLCGIVWLFASGFWEQMLKQKISERDKKCFSQCLKDERAYWNAFQLYNRISFFFNTIA